jgi:hypothetical protein
VTFLLTSEPFFVFAGSSSKDSISRKLSSFSEVEERFSFSSCRLAWSGAFFRWMIFGLETIASEWESVNVAPVRLLAYPVFAWGDFLCFL